MALQPFYQFDDFLLWVYEDEDSGNVWMLEEDLNFESVHVFNGRRVGENAIEGEVVYIPKGLRSQPTFNRNFTIEVEDAVPYDNNRIRITGGPDSGFIFRGTGLIPLDRWTSQFVPAGFQGRGSVDLTGTWVDRDTQATYWIRQDGNRIVWLAEAQSLFRRRTQQSRTFWGTRNGDTIEGEWVDLPKGIDGRFGGNRGSVRFRLPNYWTLERQSSTGMFTGSVLQRVEACEVEIVLDTLELIKLEEDPLIGKSGDEPVLFIGFAKADGETFDYGPGGRSTFEGFITDNPNWVYELGQNLKGTVTLPEDRGRYRTILRTVRGYDPASSLTQLATSVGIVVVVFEHDTTSTFTLREIVSSSFHARLNRYFRDQGFFILSGIQLQRPVVEAGTATDRELTHREGDIWDSEDDYIGANAKGFTFRDLIHREQLPISMDFRGDGAHYRLTGVARAIFRTSLE